MRTVAQYAFESAAADDVATIRLFDKARQTVTNWLDKKGALNAAPEKIVLKDGRQADYFHRQVSIKEGDTDLWFIMEPLLGGYFETTIQLGRKENRVIAACGLTVGYAGNFVAPVFFNARCPKVIRDLLALDCEWYVGQTVIPKGPFCFSSEEEGRSLVDLLLSPTRNLPIITITHAGGVLLHPDVVNKMFADLAGLALVAEVQDTASRILTRDLGRELSCFNGGIRIYWPHLSLSSDPRDHPLWTSERLLKGVTGTALASQRIRTTIRNRLFAISAYAIHPSMFFDAIDFLNSQYERESQIRKAVEKADLKELLEVYVKDNNDLIKQLADEKSNNQLLRQDLYRLQHSRAWSSSEDEVLPDTEDPPTTVSEAVERSRKIHAMEITFGSDVERGVKSLAPDAGPPSKVFEYLDYLAEMAKALRAGPLGDSQFNWLRQWGVKVSSESETVVNSKDETARRTWNDGRGQRVFETHLKPSDATSPDRCVRIYYAWDEASEKVIVGWVGRHP